MERFTRDLWESIARLHEAPHLKAAWHEVLCELTLVVPCAQGLVCERVDADIRVAPGMVVGNDPDFVNDYSREFSRIDPFFALAGRQQADGPLRASLAEEIIPLPRLRRSAYYRRFLVRNDRLCHAVGGRIGGDAHASGHVWLLRPAGQPFDEGERERVSVFMAHARAAFVQRWRLAQAKRERDAALAWLDCAEDATLILDAEGRLLIANLAGERLLRADPRLARFRTGDRGGRGVGDDWLETALDTVHAESASTGRSSTHCVRLAGRPGQAELMAVIASLPAGSASNPGTARAVLSLRDRQRARPKLDALQLKALFGFTLAESRVANALLAGHAVPDIARTWAVRADSVSAHVQNMLSKTGTRRQGELLVLLATALPNLRYFNHDA
jgi:DNA-binding CsgD family transcriptional regulator